MEVQQQAIDHVRALYASPDDPVFNLVPPEFDFHANSVYEEIGSPHLMRENIWEVYVRMRDRLEELHEQDANNQEYIEQWEVEEKLTAANEDQSPYELLSGKDLAGGVENSDGSFYMGGVNGGQGLSMQFVTNVFLNLTY